MLKHKALALGIAMAISGTAYAGSSEGVELIRNGDFSSGLEAWEKGGSYMASSSPYTPDVVIVDDSPNSQALKINGVSGSNYYATVTQEVNLTSSFSSFDISFDWKVTEKEPTYGANYVTIQFLNEDDLRIGYVSYWDTSRSDGHSLSYWRGDLEENQFVGVRKYLEVFDWENVSVNTSAMTGMDPSQVAKISVGFNIQNDAGKGGVMLVDNFSIIGNTDKIQAEPVDSCQLYAVNDKGLNNSQFFTVDPDTLAVNPIGEMYEGYDIEALEIHPDTGILYAASGDDTNNPGHLYTVNPKTGALNDLGYTGFDEIEGLSFNNDTLWAWAKGAGLISIKPQNSVTGTLVIPSPILVEDLTWDTNGTRLYTVENNTLWMSDGETVKKACDNLPGEVEALEMLPDGKLLLGIHGNNSILPFQAINVETCEIVFSAGLPTKNYDDIEGIAWPEKACADQTIATQAATSNSCQEILAMNPSSADGFYQIDPDGNGGSEPFEAYCDMTHEGGGWTLYANHADGIANIQTRELVTPTEYAAITSSHWQTVRDNMTTGMMFIDEHGRVSTISASKLKSGNCTSIQNVNDLLNIGTRGHIWHNENVGCGGTGLDYSVIKLASETYHSYRIAGAALYQLSTMKFDKWPYSRGHSYRQQNTLLYFIK